jgi:hypothetical protein
VVVDVLFNKVLGHFEYDFQNNFFYVITSSALIQQFIINKNQASQTNFLKLPITASTTTLRRWYKVKLIPNKNVLLATSGKNLFWIGIYPT